MTEATPSSNAESEIGEKKKKKMKFTVNASSFLKDASTK